MLSIILKTKYLFYYKGILTIISTGWKLATNKPTSGSNAVMSVQEVIMGIQHETYIT
jgi:hypothetical protein